MKRIMQFSILIVLIIIYNSCCQEVNVTVQTQMNSYENWLKRMNITNNILFVDTIDVKSDMTILYLKIHDQNTWEQLDSLCREQRNEYMSALLFDRFCFNMGIKPNFGKIIVQGEDVAIFIIKPRDSILSQMTSMRMACYTKGYTLKNIQFISSKRSVIYNKKVNVEKVRKELINNFPIQLNKIREWNYKKSIHFSSSSTLLFVSIDSVKGLVMRGHDYWEKLELAIHLSQNDDQFVVDLDMDGKYASGIGAKEPLETEFECNRISNDSLKTFMENVVCHMLDSIMGVE
jgi:hypothetical protein